MSVVKSIGFAALLSLGIMMAGRAAATDIVACSTRHGFGVHQEPGYDSDAPVIQFFPDKTQSTFFNVWLKPGLNKTEIVLNGSAVTGIRVNEPTFKWIDQLESRYHPLTISTAPINVTISESLPGTKCP